MDIRDVWRQRRRREFVEVYVIYMHYVEGIHNAIISAGGHHHTEAAEGGAEHAEHTY